MPRTEQTQKQLTGGNPPTKQLAAKSARRQYSQRFHLVENGKKVVSNDMNGRQMESHVVDFQQLSNQLKDILGEGLGRNDVKRVAMAGNSNVEVLFKPSNIPEISETFTRKEVELLLNKNVVAFATCEFNPDGISCTRTVPIGLTVSISDDAEYNFCSLS